MKKIGLLLSIVVFMATVSVADDIDLFIVAGQSNAQGWKGNAAYYPKDSDNLDETIRFYWVTPKHSSSDGKWTTLKAQGGRYKDGHFGLEISFARSLKKAGYNPAIFKYSRGSTSIANNWKLPGQNGMYDKMAQELDKARALLKKEGHTVHVRGFVWIQGESDAANKSMADAYYGRLKSLIEDLRKNVVKDQKLPVILGVDERHGWVKKQKQVVEAQKRLAKEKDNVVFTTMIGLEKADTTHLTPKGLVEHGKRIYAAYKEIGNGQQKRRSAKK